MARRWWFKLNWQTQENVIAICAVLVIIGVAVGFAHLLMWLMGL